MLNANRPQSFLTSVPHESKSERFQAIQPAYIESVLNNHGFDLVHLKTGNAKKQDRAAFQTTVARYRFRGDVGIDGCSLDLIFKVPHLYGKLVAVLGLFRGVCSNQLNVGTQFASVKVPHTGNPYETLNALIPQLVAQRQRLADCVERMKSLKLTDSQIRELAIKAVKTRFEGMNANEVNVMDATLIRRDADADSSLWAVFNRIQENVLTKGVRYTSIIPATADAPAQVINRVSRVVNPASVRSIELNAQLWDSAESMLKIAA